MPEEEITLRFFENTTETLVGYIWAPLTADVIFECVDLLDMNYDNFTTGYSQWHFKAKNLTYNCSEDVNLTRIDDSSVVDVFTVHVSMDRCPYVSCEYN
jgi:hypothetical protein